MKKGKEPNINNQKQKLLEVINEKYENLGGHLDNGTLLIEDQKTSLSPLLNLFDRILTSKEFTKLPSLFDDTDNFPISDMYVELAVSESLGIAEPHRLTRNLTLADEIEELHKQKRARHISLDNCVNNLQYNNVVILGDPGSGKTSLLKYLCLEIAKGENKRWQFPVFISLRQYWLEKEKYPSLTLIHYAAATLVSQNTASHVSPNFSLLMREKDETYKHEKEIIKELEGVLAYISSTDRKHVLFLLDGLDEIASNEEAISAVSEDIRHLGKGFSWVLTSRYTGFYSHLEEDIRYEVVNLHNDGIQELVTNWFKYTHQTNSEKKTKFIINQIWGNSRLLEMARNPFLLTLLCYVQNFNEEKLLPLQRNEIYTEIIDLIRRQIRTKKKDNKLFGKPEVKYLEKFCYYLYSEVENAPLQLFDQEHWNDCATPDTPPDFKQHFLSSRLLKKWKKQGDYHFVHLTFQEYFIAQHLANFTFDEAIAHIHKPQWRVVYRFLAGIYSKQQNKELIHKLIKYLLNPVDAMGLLYIEATMLLVEAGIEDSSSFLGYDIREKLWDIWCEDKSYLKNGAADALSQLSPNYIVKNHLKMVFEKKEGKLLRKSIRLLGYTNSEEADELLLNLYQDPEYQLLNEVIKALVQKDSTNIRSIIVDVYLQDKDKWFITFCKFAKESKSKEFLPYLQPFLLMKPKSISQYAPLFEAFTAIASNDIALDLLEFIQKFTIEELPDNLITCLFSLESNVIQEWIDTTLSNPLLAALKDKLLIKACEHNKISTKDFIKLLQQEDSSAQKKYINTVRIQVSNGINPIGKVVECLTDTMLSDSCNDELAFEALLDVNPQKITHGTIAQKYKRKYREFISSNNEYLASSAITILAQSSDIQSFEGILELALSKSSDHSIKIEATRALFHYHQFDAHSVISALHNIYNREKKEKNSYFAETALVTLGKVDIKEISEYVHDPLNQHSLSIICSTENILLFDDYYFDRFGTKHYWIEKEPAPKIDLSLPASEQQNELRDLCLYLLKEGLAKKSGRQQGKIPPLFYKDDASNDDPHFDISYNTGIGFLKGKDLLPDTAQKLMDWLSQKFSSFVD